MENKLRTLVEANKPENRSRWALRWKEERGNVIGIIGPSVPEELVFAAGMLPFGVSGTWQPATSRNVKGNLAIGYKIPYY